MDMTEVKVGWAREQYAKDRYDVAVDRADLPLILTEHGIDPALADSIPFSKQLDIMRLTAEVHATRVYLRREADAAGWRAGQAMPPAMAKVKADLDRRVASLAKLLADLDVKELQAAESA